MSVRQRKPKHDTGRLFLAFTDRGGGDEDYAYFVWMERRFTKRFSALPEFIWYDPDTRLWFLGPAPDPWGYTPPQDEQR